MYEEAFGLRERPFGVTPDPRVFYSNRLYAEAEASVLYGIRERRGFVLLTGEVGTGKTTVLRRVMDRLSGETPFVLVFHTNLSFDDVLAFVCHELAIAVPEPTRLGRIEALNDYLLEQTRHGHTTALLIDEAQNLSDEALEGIRLLSNLETGGEKLLQIVLAGQPELEERLAQPSLRQLTQRVALRARLERLEAKEVGAYVRRRLECAGANRSDLFTPGAIVRIAIYSKGTPRLINMICDNALLAAYATSQRTIDADLIAEVADDLRLRQPKDVPGDDVLGLETALQGVERAAAMPSWAFPRGVERFVAREPWDLPRSADRFWAALLFGLFVGGGVLALWQLRHDPWIRSWLGGTAADARALTRPDPAPEPGVQAPIALDVSPPVAEEHLPAPSLAAAGTKPPAPPSPSVPRIETTPPSRARTSPTATSYTVPSGATAYRIAGAAYGPWCQLGLDLMADANPEVEDLDRIFTRQQLRLPSLTRENLLRRARDGSERIVLASFTSAATATRFAKDATRRSGYDARVVPTRPSRNVVSYRVEIAGLSGAESRQAWRTAEQLGLLPPPLVAFADRRPNGRLIPTSCVDPRVIARSNRDQRGVALRGRPRAR